MGDSVGDDSELEAIFKDISDSETDAINGDRTLRYNEIESVFWGFYNEVGLIGVWSDFFDDSNAIDMPLHKMPIKPRVCKQCRFDMHIISIILYGYFFLCVFAKLYSKTTRSDFNHSKTSSIDRDTISYFRFVGGLDIEDVVLKSFDFSDFTH